MYNKSAHIGIFAIACMLITQSAQFSYSEEDAREKAEELTKKIQKEIDELKIQLKNKKIIWNNAKDATDSAKITYKQNPTEQNLSALNQAKKTEADAYQDYLKALKTLQDFKPDLEEQKIEKAEKDNSPKTITISDARKKAQETTQKIEKEKNDIKKELDAATKKWNNAKDATDSAKITYKQNPTEQNLSALNQAKKTEADAYQDYLKALKTLQDFKPDLEEQKIEKAEKDNSPKTITISDARKKAQEISEKIQQELDKAKQELEIATNVWKNAKNAKDSAELTYQSNPTQQNLDALWDAKKTEAEALFFYFKALSDVQNFKIQLDKLN